MLRIVVVVVVGFVANFPVVSNGEEHLLDPAPAVVRIKKALDSPTTVELVDAPLQELVDRWRERHEIEIQLDARTLDDVGAGPNSLVTANLKGISLRSALKLVLRDLDLTWIIRDDVVMITTPEDAALVLTLQIFKVEDLQLAPRRMSESDDSDAMTSIDQLNQIVTRMIEPESWADRGRPGTMQATSLNGSNVLVVRQTRDIHRRIERLLSDLREVDRPYYGSCGAIRIDFAPEPESRKYESFGWPDRPDLELTLKSATTAEFVDDPLQDVVGWWKDLHNIEIDLDIRSLDAVGLGPDTPVTVNLKNIRLKSALNLVLDPLDLTWVLENERIVITTPEEGESRLLVRLYRLDNLHLAEDLNDDLDAWARMVTTMTEPESWSSVGGPGSVAAVSLNGHRVLVVRQRFETHQQIEKLLAELRGM